MRSLAALLLAGASLVPAQDSARTIEPIRVGRKVALVIGNAEYAAAKPLRNPANDARDIGAELQGMKFDFVDVRYNLNREAMDRAIDAFTTKLRSGDLAFFYFSGHGIQVDGENYLLPVDFQGADVDARYRAYAANQIRDRMEASNARVRLLVLDACRSHPFRTSGRDTSAGLAQMRSRPEGTLIAFATGDNSVADDNPNGSNGLYTKHLLTAMRTPGLEVRDIFLEARESVFLESSRKQHPYTYDGIVGRLVLRPAPASAVVTTVPSELALQVELQYWISIKDSRRKADFEGYLRRYPNGQFAELARGRLDEQTPSSPPSADASAIYARAKAEYDKRAYTQALPLMREAAGMGHREACFYLAVMFDEGRGTPVDEPAGARWYQRAAELGHVVAMSNLGYAYKNGEGVPVDNQQAIIWLRKAADLGDANAMNNLGNMYRQGVGTKVDYAEALRLYGKAAELNNSYGINGLGVMNELGQGMPKNPQEAVRLYRKAVDLNNSNAMYNLADCYEKGVGVEQNKAEAIRWYRKSAAAGYESAKKALVRLGEQ